MLKAFHSKEVNLIDIIKSYIMISIEPREIKASAFIIDVNIE